MGFSSPACSPAVNGVKRYTNSLGQTAIIVSTGDSSWSSTIRAFDSIPCTSAQNLVEILTFDADIVDAILAAERSAINEHPDYANVARIMQIKVWGEYDETRWPNSEAVEDLSVEWVESEEGEEEFDVGMKGGFWL